MMLRRRPALGVLAAMAAGVAGGAVYGAYRRDLDGSRRRVKEGSRIARTMLGPIEYGVQGSGDPALVIHGAGGGYDQGLLIAADFEKVEVIAPSRFGYLATPLPQDASPAAQADAHAALLDSLGIDRAIVAGASAGAPSAVELALRHPQRVRALILLVPMGYAPDRPPRVPSTPANDTILRLILSGADFAYWSMLRLARGSLVRFMGVRPELEARAPAAERRRVATLMESVLPLSMRVAGIRNDSAIALQPLPLEQVAAPTLIVTTRDDLFDTVPAASYMADRIPGARLVVLDSGGHFFVGRQREVTGAIADFLADAEASQSSVRPLPRPAQVGAR